MRKRMRLIELAVMARVESNGGEGGRAQLLRSPAGSLRFVDVGV